MCYNNNHSKKLVGDLMNYKHEKLPLSLEKGRLYLINDKLKEKKEELELFLQDNKYMNSKEFSKNVLFSQEIKANNTIEGYNDDVGLVYDILNKKLRISDKDKEQRIRNLYNGYRFIYTDKEINKENLKKLYSILSRNLLSAEDIKEMGEYYRKNPVYIFFSSNLDVEPDMGIPAKDLDRYMEEYFNYVNSNNDLSCSTDYFIKSQIMHFQLVYIHPYYDINGRTSRTTSMWYLLNNEVYPYIIFNRAISLNKKLYYKIIREVKEYRNVTFFLNYMLDNVKVELEKEYVMDMISSNSSHLSAVDYQTMYYILSMNGLLTAKDFITFYNNHNDKKKGIEIYNTMLEPLLDKGIIIKGRNTDSFINSNEQNFIFELNKSKFENDPEKIKRLKIK